MKKLFLRSTALLFLSLLFWSTARADAQPQQSKAPEDPLFRTIAALDTAVFDAFNHCDLEKLGSYFTEDLEFYHEKGGLTLTRDATLATMRKNLCAGGGYHLRRELVRESMEVRPISDYGAVQTGEHRFYLTQKGQKEKLDGIGKFIMIWQQKGGEWKITRVVSYGFRPGPN